MISRVAGMCVLLIAVGRIHPSCALPIARAGQPNVNQIKCAPQDTFSRGCRAEESRRHRHGTWAEMMQPGRVPGVTQASYRLGPSKTWMTLRSLSCKIIVASWIATLGIGGISHVPHVEGSQCQPGWSTATLSEPRRLLAATSDGWGRVYFAGGLTSQPSFVSNTVDIYDVARDAWSSSTLSANRY